MSKNLKNKISKEVVENQKAAKGERIFGQVDGLMHEYYHDEDLFVVNRLVNKIKAEVGWFERISNHAPSVGSFYENLVYSAIQEVLPSDLKVGTGFVYDSDRREVSPQIDLIIYRDNVRPVLYRRADFVVVDSENVISCVEVKKTLNKSILKHIISRYTNINLGTSPLGLRGVQFLNIFSFYSKISLGKIVVCIKDSLLEIFRAFESQTVDGEMVRFRINHLVMPRLFFFDRTGFISLSCIPDGDSSISIKVNLNRSSLEGHSLGEFLVSVTSQKKNEQLLSEKNFLTYPLVMPEFEEEIYTGLRLWQKYSMDELTKLFPDEIEHLRRTDEKSMLPYAALISSSLNLTNQKLLNLEKSKGFRACWGIEKNW